MIEKIKDFLYDLSELLFALIIIGVVVIVVGNKINDSMSFSLLKQKTLAYEQTQEDFKKEIEEQQKSEEIILIDNSEETQNSESQSNDTQEDNTSNNDNSSDETTNTSNSNESVVNTIDITIDPGSTGYAIAKILKEHHLIDDINGFINRVEERNLQAKLNYGSYTFKSNDSLDTIIDKIAGIH